MTNLRRPASSGFAVDPARSHWHPPASGEFQRNLAPKERALAKLAFDPDLPPHQLDQLPADGQSQSAAAVLAGRRGIDLAERSKQAVLPVGRNADSRIANAEADAGSLPGGADQLGPQCDLPPLRELERVAEQIDEHLPQAFGIAADLAGTSGSIRHDSSSPWPQARWLNCSITSSSSSCRSNSRTSSSSLPASIFEKSSTSLMQREQVVGRGPGDLQIAGLPLVEPRVGDELEHADHAVERRANLVAHVGEEGTLRLAGGDGGFLFGLAAAWLASAR